MSQQMEVWAPRDDSRLVRLYPVDYTVNARLIERKVQGRTVIPESRWVIAAFIALRIFPLLCLLLAVLVLWASNT